MSTISVIMTCFNEGAFIGPAVHSILSQTRNDLIEKIVIVDDGSEPETLRVLPGIAALDPRVEIIYSKGNGLPKARNLAATHVTSDWIAILDGDDLWLPQKIAKQMAIVDGNREVGLVYSGVLMFESGTPAEKTAAQIVDLSRSNDVERDYFRLDGPIIPSCVLVRRDIFEKCGRFNEKIRVFEDTEFYARVAKHCKFAFVAEPLIEKRNHSSSITAKRAELMAHHAFVAYSIVRNSPRLLPLLQFRLSERARKLGNTAIGLGHTEEAKQYYRLATTLAPLSWRAALSYWALVLGVPLGKARSARVTATTRRLVRKA